MTKMEEAERKLRGARLTLSKAQRRVEGLHIDLAEAIMAEVEAEAEWNVADGALADLVIAAQEKVDEDAGRKERGTTWEDQVREEEDLHRLYYGGGLFD